MDKVSIIMPAFNAEKTIERTISSVLNQDYQNWELLIIDDNSNDSTPNVCNTFINFDSRIKYFINKNKGVSSARNYGISLATGKYIMFIDADDQFMKDAISKTVLIQKYDWIVFGYNRFFENEMLSKDVTIELGLYCYENQKVIVEKLKTKRMFNQVWNKVYRRDLIIQNDIKFDENKSFGEDYIFNIDYVRYVKEIYILDDVLYKYYDSGFGLNRKYDKNKFVVKLDNLNKLENLYKYNGWDCEYIWQQLILTCCSSIADMKFYNDIDSLKSFFENEKIKEELMNACKQVKGYKYKLLANMLTTSRISLFMLFANLFAVLNKMRLKG